MPIVKGFRRFHSNFVSSRQVATEISNLVSESNAEQSGRSSAAPLTSSRPIKKRVNNADRREMLQSFVNKYRAMNMGKFPSPTTAQKEVGGGYYSIKKMIQEMEYNFKMSTVEKGPTQENINEIKDHNIATKSDEKLEQIPRDDDTHNIATESDEKLEQNPRDDDTNNIATESDENLEQNSRIDDTHNIATESDEKLEQNPRDDNSVFKDSESKQPGRNITRDKGEEDNELRDKASLWGNMKSLATEFINMWKK